MKVIRACNSLEHLEEIGFDEMDAPSWQVLEELAGRDTEKSESRTATDDSDSREPESTLAERYTALTLCHTSGTFDKLSGLQRFHRLRCLTLHAMSLSTPAARNLQKFLVCYGASLLDLRLYLQQVDDLLEVRIFLSN